MWLPSTATSSRLPRRPRRADELRHLLLAPLSLLLVLLCQQPAQASDPSSDELKARRVAHFVAYVADDYPAAVRDGKRINKFEHVEQLALLDDAVFDLRDLGARGAKLLPTLQTLRQRVRDKVSHSQVLATASQLRLDVIGSFRLDMLPSVQPNRAQGRALFRKHCAECHGAAGTADTSKARTLTPAPISFLHPSVIERLSPLRVADTTRFGVTGTAMVPLQYLSEAERWQVGFYLMSLRHTPRTSKRTPSYAIEDLAVTSDGVLLDEMFAAGLRGLELLSALAELRTYYSVVPTEKSALIQVRAELIVARQMITWSDRAAADRHLGAAQLGGSRLARGQLAGGAGQELDERLSQLRSRLRSAPKSRADYHRDIAVIQRLITRQQIRLSAPVRRGFLTAAIAGASATARACLRPAVGLIALALLLGARRNRVRKRASKRAIGAAALALPLGMVNFIKPSATLSLAGSSGAAIAVVLSAIAVVVLVAAAGGARSTAPPAEMRRLEPTLLLLAAFTFALQAILETSVHLSALQLVHEDAIVVLLGGGATLCLATAFVIEAVIAGHELVASAARTLASSCIALILAVMFVGQLVYQLQVASVLPIDAFSWIGAPALGIYPTMQALAAQAAALLCAAVLVWRVAGRPLLAGRPQVQSSNQK